MANKIRKIVKLKQVMKKWKIISSGKRSDSDSDSETDSHSGSSSSSSYGSGSNRRIPSGSLAVYVGLERKRFVIPTRFLNLPIFVSLLKKAEEEFGYQSNGGLVLPCEVGFFKKVLKLLDKDENRFKKLGFEEMLNMFAEVDLDSSCRDGNYHGFTPLLQKTRA